MYSTHVKMFLMRLDPNKRPDKLDNFVNFSFNHNERAEAIRLFLGQQ